MELPLVTYLDGSTLVAVKDSPRYLRQLGKSQKMPRSRKGREASHAALQARMDEAEKNTAELREFNAEQKARRRTRKPVAGTASTPSTAATTSTAATGSAATSLTPIASTSTSSTPIASTSTSSTPIASTSTVTATIAPAATPAARTVIDLTVGDEEVSASEARLAELRRKSAEMRAKKRAERLAKNMAEEAALRKELEDMEKEMD